MDATQLDTTQVDAPNVDAPPADAAPAGSAPAAGEEAAPGADSPAIVTTGLTKRFRSGQLAVDGIDMLVPRGSVYGFLGPNGSGKTTTIRMLLGLVYPTQGSHVLLGVPMPAGTVRCCPGSGRWSRAPRSTRSCPAGTTWPGWTRPTGPPARAPRSPDHAALDRVGLLAAKKKHYRAYSLGMKQRLAIAASLLQPRELIILDEPTNGLDPQGTREVRGLIREIATDGITVLVSSHLLAEVEQICSHVGVMRTGQLVFQGSLEELRARGSARIRVTTTDPARAAEVLGKLGLADVTAAEGEASAALGDQAPEQVTRELVYAGVPVAGLDTPRPNLEDLFVGLTGEGFDVDG